MTYHIWLRGTNPLGRDVRLRVYQGKQRRVSDELFAKLSSAVDIYGLPLEVQYDSNGGVTHVYPAPAKEDQSCPSN